MAIPRPCHLNVRTVLGQAQKRRAGCEWTERGCRERYELFLFAKRQTPDQGRSRRDFSFSGSSANKRKTNDKRFSLPAFFKSDCTSTGFQPYRPKKAGPPCGANLTGPPSLSCEAIPLLSMRTSPDKAISR